MRCLRSMLFKMFVPEVLFCEAVIDIMRHYISPSTSESIFGLYGFLELNA